MINKAYKKTPYELWYEKNPNVRYFHSSGVRCYIHKNDKRYLKAFDERADEGIFLGYFTTSKAFRILSKRAMVIEESIHVVFDERHLDQSLKKNLVEKVGRIQIDDVQKDSEDLNQEENDLEELSQDIETMMNLLTSRRDEVNHEESKKHSIANTNRGRITNSIEKSCTPTNQPHLQRL